jgi:hypothetical protein
MTGRRAGRRLCHDAPRELAVRVLGKMMGLAQSHLKKLKERRGQLKKLATHREFA